MIATPFPLHFDPPEETVVQILSALCDPDSSLAGIAANFDTSLDALIVWLSKPAIAERIDSFESAFARRLRLVGANHLPAVFHTLTDILSEYRREVSTVPVPRDNLLAIEQRRKSRETARRAASLLVRLAGFRPSRTSPNTSRRFSASHITLEESPAAESALPRATDGNSERSVPATSVVPQALPEPQPFEALLTQLSNPALVAALEHLSAPPDDQPAHSPAPTPTAVPSDPADPSDSLVSSVPSVPSAAPPRSHDPAHRSGSAAAHRNGLRRPSASGP